MAFVLTIGNQPAGEFATEQEAKAAYYKWAIDNRAFLGDAVSGIPDSNKATINGQMVYPSRDEQNAIVAAGTNKATPEQLQMLGQVTNSTIDPARMNTDYLPIEQRPASVLAPSPFEGGKTVNSAGQPVAMGTNQQQGAPSANPAYPTSTPAQPLGGTGTSTQPSPPLSPEQQAAQLAKLNQILADPNLSADQKQMVEALYNAISTNDTAQADRLKAALQTATGYSSPYFAAQTRMVLDELDRAFNSVDGDLGYRQTSLQNSLNDLRENIAASKDYLSFQELQEMKSLERRYTQELEQNTEDMASRGFTRSSIRARKEQLMSDVYGDLRESTTRGFTEQKNALDRQQAATSRNTALEIARLRQLAAEGKTDALRAAEQQAGSTALQGAGYTGLLGGIGGEIPRAQALDSLNFANQFVF